MRLLIAALIVSSLGFIASDPSTITHYIELERATVIGDEIVLESFVELPRVRHDEPSTFDVVVYASNSAVYTLGAAISGIGIGYEEVTGGDFSQVYSGGWEAKPRWRGEHITLVRRVMPDTLMNVYLFAQFTPVDADTFPEWVQQPKADLHRHYFAVEDGTYLSGEDETEVRLQQLVLRRQGPAALSRFLTDRSARAAAYRMRNENGGLFGAYSD